MPKQLKTNIFEKVAARPTAAVQRSVGVLQSGRLIVKLGR